jgi:predicted DNA-binding WGR domain protein
MFDQAVQLEVFPTDLHLRRIDPACNMRRFYSLSVQRDLFGGACLIREWGRIGYRGQVLIETHEDEGKAITALMKLAAIKRRRGYCLPPALIPPAIKV